MPDKKISQLDPATAVFPDDLFVIARGNENKKVTLGDVNIISITYDDLEDLKNGENNHGNNADERFMTKGQWYYITDKFVYVRALSDKELQKEVFYRKHSSSRGSITLASGTQGSITSITVDGVDILGSAVAFNTTLEETMADVAAEINSFNSTPEYTAVARGAVLDIYSDRIQGIDSNGLEVSGTVSSNPGDNFVLDNETDMSGGKETLLSAKYDFDNDQVSGIVPVGFTDTNPFKDQVGAQTSVSTETTVGILNLEIQPGEKFTIEGDIDGFYENYYEGLSAKVKICGWRNENEFYICKADLIICVPFGGEGENSYSISISAQSVDRPSNTIFIQENNLFTLSGGANELTFVATINGWGIAMAMSDGDIQMAVSSSAHGGIVSTRNWLFSYKKRILKNNY